MRTAWVCATLVALVGTVHAGGAETEKSTKAQPEVRDVQFARETPFVVAVRKTRDSIVTLKVSKPGASRDTTGTGVIVDERGYVITNSHVIRGAEKIRVILTDGTSCTAEVDFVEADYDLAALKIKTDKKLKALRLAPASDVMVGEYVIAVGHPFGYTNTVSTGIVSATGREIEMPSGVTLKNLIQITAAINPGNSGGPLLNVNGELIGINVALRQDAQGIAFALNADMVQEVLSKKLSASKVGGVKHGLDCKIDVQGAAGPRRAVVVVKEVADGTPAAAAGIREGDKIIRLGDYSVGNRFDVERALWGRKAEDKVKLTVLRAGIEMNVDMPLTPAQVAKK